LQPCFSSFLRLGTSKIILFFVLYLTGVRQVVDMPETLTEDILLRSANSRGKFIDHTSSAYFNTHSRCSFAATIAPFDGKVSAIILNGRFFITSPNQDNIFLPPLGDNRPVRLRADSRYADDDPILWPQPYVEYFAHYGAIPRPHSLPLHEVIWWTPTHDDFERHTDPTTLIHGLGKLSYPKFIALKTSVDYLLKRIRRYQAATPSEFHPRALPPWVKMLEHGLAQLQSIHMNFRQLEFTVRDVQRFWLELTALLDYMDIYKPRMDGYLPKADVVANTIGVFTSDLRVAQDFFAAGLPYWLIRPASDYTDQTIVRVVRLELPEGLVTLTPHRFSYPVIFFGKADDVKKYQSIHRYARNFLRAPDPFDVPTDLGTAPPLISVSNPRPAPVPGQQMLAMPTVGSSRSQAAIRSTNRPHHAKPYYNNNRRQAGMDVLSRVQTILH
jgi:hypothetical protein